MKRVLPPALLLVGVILLWQGIASLPSVDNLTLASPVETWHSLRHDHALLFDEAGVTAVEVVLGRLISAVFGEWAGADRGLGRLVLLANNQLQTPRVYAGTVLLALMAIALFAFVSLVERLVIPWRREA